MADQQTDLPFGWARFVWFEGDVEIIGPDGEQISAGERKTPEQHLRERGLSEDEIDHALGRKKPEEPTARPRKRTIGRKR